MIHKLIETDSDYIYFFLRLVAGIIIFPYGMQKLFGWFDDFGGGVGVKEVLRNMRNKRIPAPVGVLIIIAQSFGSVALLLGCFSRIAAATNFIFFFGAIFLHVSDGWTMNWSGKKKGEGIEYFVLLLSILVVIIFKGSGPLSIDQYLLRR